MSIKIFCDIADLGTIKKFNNKSIVKGFKTNPSLMRKAGAKIINYIQNNYLKFAIKNPFLLRFSLTIISL